MVDSANSRPLARLARSKETGAEVRKRTPLEQAIAEQTNKRVRYEARLRNSGFKKTSIWVREEILTDLQALNRLMSGENGEEIARRFREFAAQVRAEA